MPRTGFSNSEIIKFTPGHLVPIHLFSWKGLDMYTPDETADDARSPYAKNFRLYAPSNASKRIAIAKRSGHAFYTVPVGETIDQSITSTTGAADQSATLTTWLAQKWTAGASGRITKADLNIKNNASGTGPLIVAIYSDSSGSPGNLLATSSVLSSTITGSYAYVSARFIEAPVIASGTAYWTVAYIQSDGTNNYKWSSTTSATTAKTSTDSGQTWSTTSFALNHKTYISTDGPIKNVNRFYSSTASPVTLFAHISDVYKVNDVTGAVTSIKSGLSSTAAAYDFANVNNKVYWVNGFDAPQEYNNTTVSAAGGSPPSTSDNVEVHANRLFYLEANTNRVVFTDAGDYETIQVTSFLYIPSPNTADPAIKMVSFQGNLVFYTRNTKYVLYGTDLASFTLRESPSKKGAVAPTACTKDESFIYTMANDGLIYAYNGGTDASLQSQRVWPITKNMASTSSVNMWVADKKLHVSIRGGGLSANNNMLVYDLVFLEWLSDEEVYTNYGISLNSQSDTNQQVEGSSLVGALYYGDIGTSDMGKPISFEFRTKYYSFGSPASKHRVKRYYPFLTGESGNYYVNCQVDEDLQNSPTTNLVNVNSAAHLYGDAGLIYGSLASGGSGLTYGNNQLTLNRISVPGAYYRTQFRFVQSGVDTPVGFEGMELFIQMRTPG